MAIKMASYGEIVWDVFGGSKKLGGAPLNFAYFCAKAGADSFVISAVGCDELGDRALETAKIAGVNIDYVARSGLPTGEVLVKMNQDKTHSFEILPARAWDAISISPQTKELLKTLDAFAYGTLCQRSARSRESLAEALSLLPETCLKIFDANIRQNFYSKEIVESSATRADFLKINEDELKIFREMFSVSENSAEAAIKAIAKRFGLKCVVLTLGGDGFVILNGGEIFCGKSLPVKVADTVGAGDSFLATFAVCLLQNKTLKECAAAANKTAAIVCSRSGAMCL